MNESTLQLVETAVSSRAPASGLPPIRGELFPRLDKARTLEDVEKVIHDAGLALVWLGDALVADARSEQPVQEALARIVPEMLAIQDDLERLIEGATNSVVARKAIVAHETLRRFFAICVDTSRNGSTGPIEVLAPVKPSLDYLRGIALRLALLVIAVEHLVARGNGTFVALVADKAFETSQTFRRAVREVGIDLTPWADAPAATRARRIIQAAVGFWSSLNDEQRRAVDEAWGERVELLPQWAQPSS